MEAERLKDGKELAALLEPVFPVTETEAEKLFGYMEGHGCLLGKREGELYRSDSCLGEGPVSWERYLADDLVDAVCEWNYQMILEEEKAFVWGKGDRASGRDRLDALKEDERLLDGVFKRTKYGAEIDSLAKMLADRIMEKLESKRGVEEAARGLAEALKGGIRLTPEEIPQPERGKAR